MNSTGKTYPLLKWLMFAIFIFAFLPLFSQDKDFGLWTVFELEKKLTKRFELEAEVGNRLDNNLSKRSESFTGLSLSYSKKKFDLSAGYRLTNEFSEKRTYDLAHRFVIQAGYKVKVKRFSLNYRVRGQSQYTAVNSTPDGKVPVSFLRNRLKLSYNVKGIKLEPAFSYELFTRLNTNAAFINQRKRLILSVSYEIFKNNEIELSLIRHETFNVSNPGILTVLGIGYKLSI